MIRKTDIEEKIRDTRRQISKVRSKGAEMKPTCQLFLHDACIYPVCSEHCQHWDEERDGAVC